MNLFKLILIKKYFTSKNYSRRFIFIILLIKKELKKYYIFIRVFLFNKFKIK